MAMCDELDSAQDLEERERAAGIARVGARLDGDGEQHCISCGEEIDPARRRAIPSAVRCEPCQARLERWRLRKGRR